MSNLKPVQKKRLEALTYGLLYPAFLGNMIYDIILILYGLIKPQIQQNNNVNLTWFSFSSLLFITGFYVVDYLHLYVDMNRIVPLRRKSKAYIYCDIATPLLFFLAFVFVKLGIYLPAIWCIALIPCIIMYYKSTNKKNKKNISFFKGYWIVSIIVGILYSCFFGKDFLHGEKKFDVRYLFFIVASFSTYTYYVFFFYRKRAMRSDIRFIHEKNDL